MRRVVVSLSALITAVVAMAATSAGPAFALRPGPDGPGTRTLTPAGQPGTANWEVALVVAAAVAVVLVVSTLVNLRGHSSQRSVAS